ncbi:MAG: pilin, partial [Patescibacteria group bacterium]
MKIVNCSPAEALAKAGKLKIIDVAVLSIILSALALPVFVFAADTGGLVPCSGVDCTFCHFFTLFQNIFNFAVTILAPAVAVFGVAYGGYWILIGGANPSNVTKGKDALKNTAIGFVIVYASYAIASTLVWFLATGIVGGSGVKFGFSGGTFQFACSSDSIEVPTKDIIKDGVISIAIDEVEPTVPIGVLPYEIPIETGIVVNKSSEDINIGSLESDVQKSLSSASVKADE